MTSYRCQFRVFLFIFFLIFLSFIVLGIQTLLDLPHEEHFTQDYEGIVENGQGGHPPNYDDIKVPILLWWTPFTGEPGRVKQCGDVECFMTINRQYKNHPQTQVFLYYGTDFKPEDLPLPRKPHHEWALLHEESPKNIYLFSHEEIMTLFNHTSTFKRESDYPITTQYLASINELESTEYLVPVKEKNKYLSEIAPVAYVHSDCNTPSDRDKFMERLSKHIPVDSLGKCNHNKDLPDHLTDALKGMDHKDFFKIMARYKFTMAFENGVCNDYVTEKLWRTFHVGSVPLVFGSPKVKDLLPDAHSAIVVTDFSTMTELADYLKHLNSNDQDYEQYLNYKKHGVTNKYLRYIMDQREWGINNDFTKINFIDGFECHICKRVHRERKLKAEGKNVEPHIAEVEHYGCPKPLRFKNEDSLERVEDEWWAQEWTNSKYNAKAIRQLLDRGENPTPRKYLDLSAKILSEEMAQKA